MDDRIARYTPRFRSAIPELQRHLWSPDPALNDRVLAWKYERNPYRSEPLIFLVLDGDRPVGMRGAYGSRWTVGEAGLPLRALTLGDAVVHPDHRVFGLLQRIDRAFLEEARATGWTHLLSTSAGRTVVETARRSGWRASAEIRPLAWSAARATGSAAGPPGTAEPDPRISVGEGPRPGPMAALVGRAPSRGAIRQARDRAYFGWRFENPLCRYQFVFLERAGADGGLDGYFVLQSHGPLHDTGINLVDWEAATPEALQRLLAALPDLAGADDVTTWPCAADPGIARAFHAAGFRTAEAPAPPWVLPRLLVRPVAEPVPEDAWRAEGCGLLELPAWDLRMTASDFY